MAITQTKTPICVECFDKLENIKQLENTLKDIKKVLKRS
jgi:PII-like signaling protein